MTTTLTRWSHACIRLDRGSDVLVIDPGMFTDHVAALAGCDAILITHEHGDHLDVEAVAAAAGRGAQVWGPAAALALLTDAGVADDALHAVVGGDTISAGGFEVAVVGEWHEQIHPDIPVIANVGYVVERVLHPGDSFVGIEPDAVDTLLVPLAGPWLKLADAVDFVRALAPTRAVIIHDAHLSEPGVQLSSMLVARLGGAGDPVNLAPGESIEL
ncbi:MBL fold metallo-hydrolase [Cellulomonas sp. PhB150]|uniref:MBL fold metallo-hydrolase n=1 Tax=Cellulomonas sp. PhB150 TaxID=2485188 RepID=UPI000F4AD633|nr:MBL fold metallo-hydrolase [Cellulomonas sp. PhB150]ROS30620.1 L-ascorbate metabolism protein UlaG (beta-lactamase superfamily) [Cellulomonas sp. PhB150]